MLCVCVFAWCPALHRLLKSERDHQLEKKHYMKEIRQLRAVLNSKHAQLSQLLLEKK